MGLLFFFLFFFEWTVGNKPSIVTLFFALLFSKIRALHQVRNTKIQYFCIQRNPGVQEAQSFPWWRVTAMDKKASWYDSETPGLLSSKVGTIWPTNGYCCASICQTNFQFWAKRFKADSFRYLPLRQSFLTSMVSAWMDSTERNSHKYFMNQLCKPERHLCTYANVHVFIPFRSINHCTRTLV